MDINPILEERRLAIAALKEIAEHDELVDEADAYHGLRNTAQDALKALGVPYDTKT